MNLTELRQPRILVLPTLLLSLLACTPAQPASTPPVFTDVSAEVGLEERSAEYGPFWADLDSDGWLDLVFMNHGLPSIYFNEEEGKVFSNRIESSGLRSSGWEYPQQDDRHGGSCADYDNDGDVDLFIGHGAFEGKTLGVKFDELLYNRGDGTFVDVSRESGALNQMGRTRASSWADFDGDGWLDLFIGNFESPNILYRNNGDGTFSDATSAMGVASSGARVAWADFDGDHRPDLSLGWPLQILRNEGAGRFSDATDTLGLASPHLFPFSLTWGDFDGDHDLDLHIGSVTATGVVFLNDHGRRFTMGPMLDLPPDEKGAASVWADLDNDGDLDLLRSGSHRLRLFQNLGRGTFATAHDILTISPPVESGVQIAAADYDGDGYLDLALDANRHHLLKNQGGDRSWLQLTFQGSSSNRMGLGAKVWVKPIGASFAETLYREYWGDYAAYRSAGCAPLHIGLDTATAADLRVLWPSGLETRLNGVQVNRTIQIHEPASKPTPNSTGQS